MSYVNLILVLKGGAGSGNFGHAGRPGKRGGSVSRSSGIAYYNAAPSVAVDEPGLRTEGKTALDFIKLDFSGNISDYQRRATTAGLQAVPAWHLPELQGGGVGFSYLKVTDKMDVLAEEKQSGYRPSNPNSKPMGFAICDSSINPARMGHVYMAASQKLVDKYRFTAFQTVIHETAHMVFDYAGDPNRPYTMPKDTPQRQKIMRVKQRMEDLYNAKVAQHGKTNITAITQYAKTNPAEYRAESYLNYITNPNQLKNIDPEAHDIIAELFL